MEAGFFHHGEEGFLDGDLLRFGSGEVGFVRVKDHGPQLVWGVEAPGKSYRVFLEITIDVKWGKLKRVGTNRKLRYHRKPWRLRSGGKTGQDLCGFPKGANIESFASATIARRKL